MKVDFIEYRNNENTGYYYRKGNLIATLDFNSDELKTDEYENFSKVEKEKLYQEMTEYKDVEVADYFSQFGNEEFR